MNELRSHYFNASERRLFTDPAAPGQFADLWRDLSRGLMDRPTDQVADRHEDWNRAAAAPYRALREAEPCRTIVLGSNLWNQAYTFEFLAVPVGDPDLVLTFHYYYPMHLTHYRAR